MGQEFRVNTYEDNWQDNPVVQTFSDGSFVIMWRSYYFPSSTYFIGGQRYAANGTPIGSEFIVDGVVGSASEVSNITLLTDGAFVVTFRFSDGGLLETDEIWAKVYNADFTVRKDSFRVDTIPAFQSLNPSAAALADGGFIVYYNSDASGPNFDDIYGQRYTAAGVAVGTNFLVNTVEADNDQSVTEVVQLTGGNFLIAWHSKATLQVNESFYSHELRGTLVNSAGVAIRTDFSIADAEGSTTTINPFSFTPLSNGGFAVARYETENPSGNIFTYDVKLALYDAAGNRTGPEITAFSATVGLIYSIDLVQLKTGQIVVVWETPATPLSTYANDIQGRIFGSDGTPLGAVFDVAQNRFNEQEDPEIAALANGGFVVTYMSEAADADHDGIAARIFEGPFPADPGANQFLTGTEAADTLTGLSGNDTLVGNGGDDQLNGGAGNDILYGGTGNDDVSGNSGSDILVLGAGDDTAYVGTNTLQDYAYGGDGNDLVVGDAGNFDILLGNAGNDTINGGAGNTNYMFSGTGNNTMVGGATQIDVFISEGTADIVQAGTGLSLTYRTAAGSLQIIGGAGIDQFVGGLVASNDIVNGAGNDDYLFGGDGNDLLRGEAGNDVIIGQNGNDTLEGGAGVNLLWANDAGNDQIRVATADGGTQVVEFFEAGGTNDVVRLIGSGLTNFAGIENLVANIGVVQGTNLIVNAGSGAQLYYNVGQANQGAIWFQGVSAYSLTSGDFLFG